MMEIGAPPQLEATDSDHNAPFQERFWISGRYAPFFGVGAIYAVPHPGNHGVGTDTCPVLYDFVSFRLFPESFGQGVWTLRKSLRLGEGHVRGLRPLGVRRPVEGRARGARPLGGMGLRAYAARGARADGGGSSGRRGAAQ